MPFVALGNYIRLIGLERCCLVTDAVAPAGLGPGRYTLGRWDVVVGEDRVAMAPDRSHFIGAAITMPEIEKNLMGKLGLSREDARRLTCGNPRAAVGV